MRCPAASGRAVMVVTALAAAVGLVAAAPVPRPFKTGITTVDIERAIALGQSPGSGASQRFHDGYVLHVTFSPHNVYYTMPHFGMVLYGRPQSQAAGRIDPLDLLETPRYVSGQPAPPGTPILGGMVEAIFAARALDRRGVYLAGIDLEGREVRRVELDFGRVD